VGGRVVLSSGSLEAARPTAPSPTRNRRAGIAGRDRYPGDSVPVPTGLQLAYEGGPGGCSEGEYGAVGCLAVTDGGEAGGSGGPLDALAARRVAVAALVPSGGARRGSGRACRAGSRRRAVSAQWACGLQCAYEGSPGAGSEGQYVTVHVLAVT